MSASFPRRISRGIAIAVAFASSYCSAETYYFQQSGFTAGGHVVGSFQGQDLNQDGMIVFWHGEVSAFSLSFSGSSVVPQFDYGLSDLMALNYEVGTPFLGDSTGSTPFTEGVAAVRQGIGPRGYEYHTGYLPAFNGGAAIFSPTLELVETSPQLLSVSPVSEPGTQLIFALGLVAVLARRFVAA